MTIHLSALGWVDDVPRGHRLRWHYPFSKQTEAQYLGLPKTIIVERAPLDQQHVFGRNNASNMFRHKNASSLYPELWWDSQNDVTVPGFVAPHEHVLTGPVQAVSFRYNGPPGRVVIRNGVTSELVLDCTVADGDTVYAEAPALDSILLFASWARLEEFRTLDLFRDHGLPFKPIAKIAVAATFLQGFAAVAGRCEGAPLLSMSEWSELQALAAEAKASTPATATPGRPTAWETFAIVLGLRWEIALLCGFAFFDGPHSDTSALDSLSKDVLARLPATTMVYRIRDDDGPEGISNLVLCEPWPAAQLAAPMKLWYIEPEVRLREPKSFVASDPVLSSQGLLDGFAPLLNSEADYWVQTRMGWQHADARALGVEVEEEVSPSVTTGAPARQTTFMSRSRRADNPPLQGSLARSFDVAFPDVTLRMRARATDGWDRVSDWSAWTLPMPLALRHEPPAPPLETAAYNAGTARIDRTIGRLDFPDWAPDPLVQRSSGQVFVYRRIVAPRTATATTSVPRLVAPGVYRANITGASNLADFVGGAFSVGSFTESITASSTTTIDFAVPDNGGAVTLFSGGFCRLTQRPTHSALWKHVATFAAVGLPAELVFADPLTPSSSLAVESYMLRLSYLGRLGPESNVVCALRNPTLPVIPPPFVVTVLGIDFYRRTLVSLRFTAPPAPGRYTIWWADGEVASADLPRRGAPGTYGAQTVDGGSVLYDVIALPIPSHVGRVITFGVQCVGESGVQSDFVTGRVVLPPLAP